MNWQSYITGLVSAPVIAGFVIWLGKVWAGRILEKDKVRYQTAMESLLQDMRTKDNKELLVHRLQFEKEFTIYQDLWVCARSLAIACQGFGDLQAGPPKPHDELLQELVDANTAFCDVVRSNEPFYSTEVYHAAEELRKLALSLCLQDRRLRRLEGRSGESEKFTDKLIKLDEQKLKTLDDIPNALPKLRDAIRERIWSSNDTGWGRAQGEDVPESK